MTNPGDPFAVIFAEFERLGLSYLDLPGLAMAGSDEAEFLERSRAAGFAIYGAGFWGPEGTPEETRQAMIIFDREAGPQAVDDFWPWVESQGDMALHWFARAGEETYAPPS